MSNPTPRSALVKLRHPASKQEWEEEWHRLVRWCTPILSAWAIRLGHNRTQADDLVQEIVIKLFEEMKKLSYNPEQGPFRPWLYVVAKHKWYDLNRSRSRATVTEPLPSYDLPDTAEAVWEEEYRAYAAGRVKQLMKSAFPDHWEPCLQIIQDGKSPEEVARAFGTTAAALRMAKCRILARLETELQELKELLE